LIEITGVTPFNIELTPARGGEWHKLEGEIPVITFKTVTPEELTGVFPAN
jgi:hypothetical protein